MHNFALCKLLAAMWNKLMTTHLCGRVRMVSYGDLYRVVWSDSHLVLPNLRVGKRSFKREHTWMMEFGSSWGLLLAIINNLDACHSDVLSVRVLTFF